MSASTNSGQEHLSGKHILSKYSCARMEGSSTASKPTKSKQQQAHIRDNSSVCVFTLRPPVFSFMGVRKGSKIIWLVSMSTGDCLFPTEQRFQAELTSPQNDGTATQRHSQGGNMCGEEIGAGFTRTPQQWPESELQLFFPDLSSLTGER